MTGEFDALVALVKRHEGLRLKLYKCTEGKLTIGYGRNIEENGVTEDEASRMLTHDLLSCYSQADRGFPWFAKLSLIRKRVVVSMIFNMGFARFSCFKKMVFALEQQDYNRAANEMLASHWSSQVGKRSIELSEMMRTGVSK